MMQMTLWSVRPLLAMGERARFDMLIRALVGLMRYKQCVAHSVLSAKP